MSGPRYSQWTHARIEGDVGQSSRLTLLARKLLGFLDGQRRLSGVKTLVAKQTLADGSVIHASFIGDVPSISMSSAATKRVPSIAALRGFVTKPRKFGTATADDGQNAFGQDAHTILTPALDDAGTATWKTRFFNSTFGAVTFSQFFAAGLSAHGNVDWRSADEQVSVSWVGAPSRTWASSVENYFGGILDPTIGTRVFHNGREILNHPITYAQTDGRVVAESIVGACLRRSGGGARLIYITRNRPGTTAEYVVRAYSVPLKVDLLAAPWLRTAPPNFNPLFAPLFVPAAPAEITKIGEIVFPSVGDGSSGYGMATMFFNQHGTEARGIVVTNGVYDLGFIEVIAELAPDLSEVTFSTVDHGGYHWDRTTTTDYITTSPAVYTLFGVEESIYSSFDNKVEDYLQTRADAPSSPGPFPVAVDYQDNEPVYLWYTPENVTRTVAITSSWSSSETGDPGVGTGESITAVTDTETTSEAIAGGRLFAVDKDGVTWLDEGTDRESLLEFTSTSTLDLASTGMSWTNSSSRLRDDTDPLKPGHFFSREILLWWLDLRSRSATYSVATEKQVYTQTASSNATGGPTVDGTGYADPDSRLTTSEVQTDYLREVTTPVIFYGETVRTMVSSRLDEGTPTISTQTSLFTLRPFHLLDDGPGTDSTTGTVLVSEQDIMDENTLWLPAFLADTAPFIEDTTPDIDKEPESSTDPAYAHYDVRWGSWIAYQGAWAYSMHDLDRTDPRSLQYTHGVKDGDLVELTGDRAGVECFEQMWPLSYCAITN